LGGKKQYFKTKEVYKQKYRVYVCNITCFVAVNGVKQSILFYFLQTSIVDLFTIKSVITI